MVGWYYRLKEYREPEFVEIWAKYLPEHSRKIFSKGACYGVDLNSKIQTRNHLDENFISCKEIELSELENYLRLFTNKEIIYELW
jgi:hypothetical protein